MNRALAALLFPAFLTAGCVSGTDYKHDAPTTPQAWSEATSARVAASDAELSRWWATFGDPTLDRLVERAVAANLDLASASARIREARAQAGQVRSERMPQLDARGSATRSRTSENGALPVADAETDLYSAGFDSRWELDLFGGTRRAIEAAEADIDATIADRDAVLVSLVAEVAAAYVDLRGNQHLSSVAHRNLGAARTTLHLTRSREAGGLSTSLDVSRAEALLSSSEAAVPQFEANARIALHRIEVLLGAEPGSLAFELEDAARIPAPPERVLVGLPSQLLQRRPDVRAAERRLAAANARIGAAEAQRYPSVSLTGAFGLEASSSGDFADAASRAWSIGPSLRWPIFSGGRIDAEVEAQDARTEQARLAYRQALLVALEEVENGLVRYLREWDHRRALESTAAADRKSVELANELYRKGLTSFLDVLDAERALYASELELAASEAAVTRNVVALYKSLGGGWDVEG